MLKIKCQQQTDLCNAGLTLIELIVTIAIASILLLIAIPSFQGFIANNEVDSTSNEFIESLTYARSEAVRRNLSVTICASNTSQTGCAGAVTWRQNGWLVFVDPTSSGALASQANLIQVVPAQPTALSFTSAQNTIIYSGEGFLLSGADTYKINNPKCIGQNGRQIVLSNAGLPAVTYIQCA